MSFSPIIFKVNLKGFSCFSFIWLEVAERARMAGGFTHLTSKIQLVILQLVILPTDYHFSINATSELSMISEWYPQLISLSFLITCLQGKISEFRRRIYMLSRKDEVTWCCIRIIPSAHKFVFSFYKITYLNRKDNLHVNHHLEF